MSSFRLYNDAVSSSPCFPLLVLSWLKNVVSAFPGRALPPACALLCSGGPGCLQACFDPSMLPQALLSASPRVQLTVRVTGPETPRLPGCLLGVLRSRDAAEGAGWSGRFCPPCRPAQAATSGVFYSLSSYLHIWSTFHTGLLLRTLSPQTICISALLS